jgi:hypothetical protein
MVRDEVRAEVGAWARRFQSARPFRHVVIDDFLEPGLAAQLLAGFPPFDAAHARNEDGRVGGKAVIEGIRALGPAYAALDALVKGEAFLGFVSQLTGIPGLLYDPHYFGGGTHDNRDGQALDAHVDFNRHPVTHAHRRLNLIVYLNPDWRPEWGGVLELHRDPRAADDEVVAIAPLFNRAVVFETTEHSWHGFSRIVLPASEAGRSRRSVALYFYTAERPAEETADTHSTVYVDAPLPAQVAIGHTLDAADVASLQALVAQRDQHIARLYRDLQAAQAKLEQALRLVGVVRGSAAFRAAAWLRRRLRGNASGAR